MYIILLVAQTVKHMTAMRETWVRSLGYEDALENGIAINSSILACRIPWTKEPGRLQSMWSQRVGQNWVTFTHMILKRSSQLILDVLIQIYLYLASVMSDSLWPNGLYSLWNSPGQITGMGSRSLLQGTFPTQGSNLGLWHCRQILYQLSHQGSPIFIQKNDEQRKGIESEKTGRGEEGSRQQQVRGGRRGEEAISSFLQLREVTKDTSGYKVHPNYLE